MNYSFHPDAEDEFNKAIDYYEDCQDGLGNEFVIEVYLAIERAVAYPKAWQAIDGEVRRSLVTRGHIACQYAATHENSKGYFRDGFFRLERKMGAGR